jgi:hypothetical protein
LLLAVVLFAAGRAASAQTAAHEPSATVKADAAVLAEFKNRIDGYMKLRSEAAGDAPDAKYTDDPAYIRAREEALAARIRALRANAKHGDILTPEIRTYFRRLVAPDLKGEHGRDIKALLQEDAPAPGAIPLEVNARSGRRSVPHRSALLPARAAAASERN